MPEENCGDAGAKAADDYALRRSEKVVAKEKREEAGRNGGAAHKSRFCSLVMTPGQQGVLVKGDHGFVQVTLASDNLSNTLQAGNQFWGWIGGTSPL